MKRQTRSLSNIIISMIITGLLLLLFSGNKPVTASADLDPATSTSTPTQTSSPTPTLTPTPQTGLTLESTSYGCTAGPYITCSASVVTTHTDPYRWDFDITYTYGDTKTWIGSNFAFKLKFNTGIYYTGTPIWWNMYPITNEVMPNRKIDIYYSGVSDLDPMSYPSGDWTVPGQPIPYNDFTVVFSRTTTAPEILVRTDKWHLTIATYPNVATPTITPTFTPTNTPTATFTNTPTITPTPTIGTWYTGGDRSSVYGVKALISAPLQAPFIEGSSPPSGQSNWVSIPSPYWIQAGWRYYITMPGGEGSVALPYVEWNMSSAPLGEDAYGYRHYGEDIQAWGTSKQYRVEWLSGESWCGTAGDNTPICKIVGVSPPKTGFAHSEVHASSLNQLDTLFSTVMYKDVNGDWFLFDQVQWRTQMPYDVDIYSDSQFRNYGP